MEHSELNLSSSTVKTTANTSNVVYSEVLEHWRIFQFMHIKFDAFDQSLLIFVVSTSASDCLEDRLRNDR